MGVGVMVRRAVVLSAVTGAALAVVLLLRSQIDFADNGARQASNQRTWPDGASRPR